MTCLATIHVGRKQLGLDDDTARDLYEQTTGKRSLRAMSETERLKVVSIMRQRGFKSGSNVSANGRKKLTGRYSKKLQALWIAGWNLGVVNERDDTALLAFVKRQTGIDHVQFMQSAKDARKAIEALKSWVSRVGGVDWSTHEFDPPYACSNGFKIAWAQWLKLGHDVHATSTHQFWDEIGSILGHSSFFETGPTAAEWVKVMNHFGGLIRAKAK